VTGTGRYIRMYGTARATPYGYSLWEFQVYAGTSPSPSPSPTGSGGSGAPPASFWGNTGAIPAAHNVLEVSVVNQTNGQYPDSQVYWSFNGQTESIAQQPYIDMPANSAGRMYFYLGTPNGPYYDFIEFTVGSSSINVDTTRVDRFGLKLALLLHGHDGSNQEVGENYATFQESRAATFQRFENSVPGRQPDAVRRAEPARRAAPGGAAIRSRQLLPGRAGELLRPVLARQRHQRPAVRLSLRRRRRAVLGHLGHQPAVHGGRRRLVAAPGVPTGGSAHESHDESRGEPFLASGAVAAALAADRAGVAGRLPDQRRDHGTDRHPGGAR
jgi:hypothetical protein